MCVCAAYLRRFRHISMALFFIQTLLAAVRKGKRVRHCSHVVTLVWIRSAEQ